jgi:hypothetical protein
MTTTKLTQISMFLAFVGCSEPDCELEDGTPQAVAAAFHRGCSSVDVKPACIIGDTRYPNKTLEECKQMVRRANGQE